VGRRMRHWDFVRGVRRLVVVVGVMLCDGRDNVTRKQEGKGNQGRGALGGDGKVSVMFMEGDIGLEF